eukprot:3788738-Prymnesium_polylepis.1
MVAHKITINPFPSVIEYTRLGSDMQAFVSPPSHLNRAGGAGFRKKSSRNQGARDFSSPLRRRHRERSGAMVDEIDLYFGWKGKVLKKAMQMHYAGMSLFETREDALGHASPDG